MKEKIKNIISVVIVIVFLVFIFINIQERNRSWIGVYYPNGCLVCEDDYIYSPRLDSFLECQDWAIETNIQRSQFTNTDSDLAECGRGCRLEEENELLICKETLDVDVQ